jgi:hypothetical protein
LGRASCENYTSLKIWQPCLKIGQGWHGRGWGNHQIAGPCFPPRDQRSLPPVGRTARRAATYPPPYWRPAHRAPQYGGGQVPPNIWAPQYLGPPIWEGRAYPIIAPQVGGLGGGTLEVVGVSWGGDGLGPCTTPSIGCPFKLLFKLDDLSISFGDFNTFW